MVQADEFGEIRLKTYEKKFFRDVNSNSGIKFPVKVDLAMDIHKRSLIIQSELGNIDLPMDEQFEKQRRQIQLDTNLIFHSVHRLVRCLVDIQIYFNDAIGARSALELERSLSARAWDNSPLTMRQIKTIGPVAVRKLALNDITSIESLEATEPERIDLLLSKNPPFGRKVLSYLKGFPKLRVSVRLMSKVVLLRIPCVRADGFGRMSSKGSQ